MEHKILHCLNIFYVILHQCFGGSKSRSKSQLLKVNGNALSVRMHDNFSMHANFDLKVLLRVREVKRQVKFEDDGHRTVY